MFDRSSVLVVMGHDGRGQFPEMAEVAESWIRKWGYQCSVFEVEPTDSPLHMKTNILNIAVGLAPWVVWMDVDSIAVAPIDELFNDDYDVGVAVKERYIKSKKHGSYLYAGLSVWRDTKAARWFLGEYSKHHYSSDQKELHAVVENYITLDNKIFKLAGKIFNTDKFKLKLFDPHIYVHQKSLHDMNKWPDDVNILHFKGALQKRWKSYVDSYCRIK